MSERIEALNQTTGETSPTRAWLPGQVPLLIGVTGHLEIRASDLDALREQIRQALRRLIKDLPRTPFAVMSSLAEGGDRIVADIALEKEFNARLIVPLPMRRELYEEDFRNSANSENPGDRPSLTPNNPSSNTSLKEFRRFLDHPSTTWFELESHLGRGEVAPVTAEAIRKRRYAAAGAFIVRNCQILFALWDGVENADEGGTADTKNFKLHGVPRGYLPAEYSGETWDVGPVFHFHAPRKNSTLPATKDVPMVPLYPRSFEYHNREEAADFYSERIFKPLEDFNAGVSAIERGESDVDLNRPLKFIPAKQLKSSVSESEASALNAIESVAAKADGLSLHFQPRTNGTAIALSIFVLLGAISLEYSTHFLNGEHDHLAKFIFLLLYPVSMVVAFAFYRVARSGRFQDQYQDYRALAEGLRVQYFWHAAGVSVPVAENYLPSHRFELNWINNACRAVELLNKSSGAALDRPRTDIVIEHWIRDQLRYYEASWKKNHRRLLGWEIAGSGSLLLGLVIVVAVAVAGIGHAQEMFHGDLHEIAAKLADHNDSAHMWAMMFAVISAVIAALSHSWIQRAAYEEHIKQYARMIRIFKDHLKEIRSLVELGDYRSIKTELLALGREALMENSAWVLTHRERPLEVPHH